MQYSNQLLFVIFIFSIAILSYLFPQETNLEVADNSAQPNVNNYRRNDWKPYVYHTADSGKTWIRIVDENKVRVHF